MDTREVQAKTAPTEGRPPTRDEREQAAAAVRAMQSALAPQVDALYGTPSGMDVFEAFDHFGRAADALHHGIPGATGIALAELTAAAELLRNAAGRSTETAIALNPIASLTEEALASVGTWPVTHASTEREVRVAGTEDARLILTQPEEGTFVLTDAGVEVARFAAESDALAAVAEYMPEMEAMGAEQGTPFNIFLTPEGFESGDGRLWELGTVTWRDPPLPLMFQDTASHGAGDPNAAWFAGAIDRVWRDPADASRIMGRGRLMPGADGDRAEATIRAGLRGVSIDGVAGRGLPPVKQVTQIDGEGNPVTALVRYSDTRVLGAAVVPHPAFEPCCIWFDDEPTPERVTATHGQHIPLDSQPEVVNLEPLIASGGGPLHPPAAWFHVEHPKSYQQVRVTPEGQITGHIGPTGTCHIGIAGKCETIPSSATGYRYFHRSTALTAEGEKIRCGWLTMNTGHESTKLDTTAATAIAHYDNTGTQVAKVRIVDTPQGPWMCGAVAPGLDEQTLWKLQGPDVSGDWRDIDGHHRELVACLAVPLPGFMPRPEALVASGRIVAQIGALPCDDCGPSPLVESLAAAVGMHFDPERLASLERMVAALRPTMLANIQGRVSPPEMVEAARKATEPDPAQEWRDRLRV